jgi:hypothetical protein
VSTSAGPPGGPRLVDAMPRPLLVVFALAAVAGIVISLAFIIRPPAFEAVPLQDRRPPPHATYAHDPVRVFPAPLPDFTVDFEPPCAQVRGVRVLGGSSFVARVGDALGRICTLRGASIDPQVKTAVAGLGGATLRIATFERSGIESTLDFSTGTIWLNLKLTRRDSPVQDLIPVLAHEAWHLANASDPVTAEHELAARRVEHAVCRELIPVDDWPRWCSDARDLATMPAAEAVALLASAGFDRAVSS